MKYVEYIHLGQSTNNIKQIIESYKKYKISIINPFLIFQDQVNFEGTLEDKLELADLLINSIISHKSTNTERLLWNILCRDNEIRRKLINQIDDPEVYSLERVGNLPLAILLSPYQLIDMPRMNKMVKNKEWLVFLLIFEVKFVLIASMLDIFRLSCKIPKNNILRDFLLLKTKQHELKVLNEFHEEKTDLRRTKDRFLKVLETYLSQSCHTTYELIYLLISEEIVPINEKVLEDATLETPFMKCLLSRSRFHQKRADNNPKIKERMMKHGAYNSNLPKGNDDSGLAYLKSKISNSLIMKNELNNNAESDITPEHDPSMHIIEGNFIIPVPDEISPDQTVFIEGVSDIETFTNGSETFTMITPDKLKII